MSVILRPRPVSPSAMAVAGRHRSGRNLAALATGGAAILALLLAVTLPVRAESRDDLADLRPAKHQRVPLDCAISINGSDRAVTLYVDSCLKDHGLKHLPKDCSNRATIFGERDRVYSAQCLRSAGFKFSTH